MSSPAPHQLPPPGYGGYGYQPQPVPPTSGLAIASLVCGVLGLFACYIFSAIPAVICGHMALKKIRLSQGQMGGAGVALAGVITGYVGIAATVVVLLIWGAALAVFLGLTTVAVTGVTTAASKAGSGFMAPIAEAMEIDQKLIRLRQACLDHAAANGGVLPADLDELVKEGLLVANDVLGPKGETGFFLLLMPGAKTAEPHVDAAMIRVTRYVFGSNSIDWEGDLISPTVKPKVPAPGSPGSPEAPAGTDAPAAPAPFEAPAPHSQEN